MNALSGKVATTLTAVLLVNDKLHLLHVGDTRLYQFKKDKKQLLQLTHDHSVLGDNNDTLS